MRSRPQPPGQALKHVLPCGLRLMTDVSSSGTGTLGVALFVGVGSRNEPLADSGLAHLLEHLTCRNDGVADASLLAAGGFHNAVTQPDYTAYYSLCGSEALPDVLARERRRFDPPQMGEDELARERAIVSGEIGDAVHGQVLGGFPWFWLAEAAFQVPEHAHNGYGDLTSLARVTPSSAVAFHREHYRPDNSLLVVCGDADAVAVERAAARAFDDLARFGSPTLLRTPREEPDLVEDRTSGTHDGAAEALRGTAVAWRAPLPTEGAVFLAHVVLADILASDTGGVLEELLPNALDVGAYLGLFGNPLEMSAPVPWIVDVVHRADLTHRQILAAARAALDLVATGRYDRNVVRQVAGRLSTQLWRTQDDVLGGLLANGALEFLHGLGGGLPSIAQDIVAVTPADCEQAARVLSQQHVAVLRRCG